MSGEETARFGSTLACCISKSAGSACTKGRTENGPAAGRPVVIGLQGKLGAGKTTLTQGMAQELGIEEAVSSPTFLMLNEYQSGRFPLYHFDLYRLQEDLDLDSAAFAELKGEFDELMVQRPDALAVIEWVDLCDDFVLDYEEIRVILDYDDKGLGRILQLRSRGAKAALVLDCALADWTSGIDKRQAV